jgi:hypothetical protein
MYYKKIYDRNCCAVMLAFSTTIRINPSVNFAVKTETYQRGAITGLHSNVRLQVLPANVSQLVWN